MNRQIIIMSTVTELDKYLANVLSKIIHLYTEPILCELLSNHYHSRFRKSKSINNRTDFEPTGSNVNPLPDSLAYIIFDGPWLIVHEDEEEDSFYFGLHCSPDLSYDCFKEAFKSWNDLEDESPLKNINYKDCELVAEISAEESSAYFIIHKPTRRLMRIAENCDDNLIDICSIDSSPRILAECIIRYYS